MNVFLRLCGGNLELVPSLRELHRLLVNTFYMARSEEAVGGVGRIARRLPKRKRDVDLPDDAVEVRILPGRRGELSNAWGNCCSIVTIG